MNLLILRCDDFSEICKIHLQQFMLEWDELGELSVQKPCFFIFFFKYVMTCVNIDSFELCYSDCLSICVHCNTHVQTYIHICFTMYSYINKADLTIAKRMYLHMYNFSSILYFIHIGNITQIKFIQ